MDVIKVLYRVIGFLLGTCSCIRGDLKRSMFGSLSYAHTQVGEMQKQIVSQARARCRRHTYAGMQAELMQ